MGIHVIKMPDIGEGIAEVELVAWHVKVGDAVVEDQVLADVMTDKATVEIPSPVSGTIAALNGQVGEVIAVGAGVIHIEVDGAGNLKATSAAAQALAPTPAPAVPVTVATPPALESAPAAMPATALARGAATTAREPARRASAAAPRAAGEKPLASPAVRKRAWDMGVELQFVTGSGPAGGIGHDDLDAYLAQCPSGGGVADTRFVERTGEEQIPVIGLRRKIAQKMQESKRRIPHFSYVEEVDVTELEALRVQLNTRWVATRGKLTLLPLLLRAVVQAVRAHPQVNARYDDEGGVLTRFEGVHAGIATQTDGGLLVPVVRHAESRNLWGNAAEITRLAAAAREGRATRDELTGSSITLTSLGPLGGIVTTPVINHPEVAIVGVNRIVERPMYRNGALVPRLMMNLSSSFDHRVVDGFVAAQFIQDVRASLEHPATLFVD